MRKSEPYPVIDIFAGPGGLSEGFSSISHSRSKPGFEVMLSIEKDYYAHRTLELRAFYRFLKRTHVPEDYYRYLRGPDQSDWIDRDTLFSRFPDAAEYAAAHAWKLELKPDNHKIVNERIEQALSKKKRSTPWVLIGGPPCQAYSLAGRSRMRPVRGNDFDNDERHTLYKEYLQIIKDHKPDVFVMENVKGIISSKLYGKPVFELICDDLRNAGGKDSYRLFSMTTNSDDSSLFEIDLKPKDFVIESEDYGIPQTRHRVIIIGIRVTRNGKMIAPRLLKRKVYRVPLYKVINDLPRVRSGLSKIPDSDRNWKEVIHSVEEQEWLKELEKKHPELARKIQQTASQISAPRTGKGGNFVNSRLKPGHESNWFHDRRIQGALNHKSKSHMESDLHRYLFVSCYARLFESSPRLHDFPESLLPAHKNITTTEQKKKFSDRFRAQLRNQPATTITSHIRKDGHYYIHYDPKQCRSLTVREAARIQTFPDNYFIEGPRTEQNQQIGNAVPPLLARQIGERVRDLLESLR